jgi:hypothetical protein
MDRISYEMSRKVTNPDVLVVFDSFLWRKICQHDSNMSPCVPPEFVRARPHNNYLPLEALEIRTRGITKTELTSVCLLELFRTVSARRFIVAESTQRLLNNHHHLLQIVAGGLKCGIRVNRVDMSHFCIVAGSQLGVWWKWPTSESRPSTSSPSMNAINSTRRRLQRVTAERRYNQTYSWKKLT